MNNSAHDAARTVSLKEGRILIDGKPQLILSAEIHYFRLQPEEWAHRLDEAVNAGFNTIASYIPWYVHEHLEGQCDLTGERAPYLDLGHFLELIEARGLFFIARPGPFIMAEVKNEGIPDWVYGKYPDIQGGTWHGAAINNASLDYLHPGFLKETEGWYSRVMPLLAKHHYRDGGCLISVQLDNEVGMLPWVSNQPVLSPRAVAAMRQFALENEHFAKSPGFTAIVEDEARFAEFSLAPDETYSLAYHELLGRFLRRSYRDYLLALREMTRDHGITDLPLAINIHGTGGGRGLTYPIGVSQLYDAIRAGGGFYSGTDIYLGDLGVPKFQDLYILNAMTDAVNDADQPLTSLEFECGSADYGERFGGRTSPAAVDHKARMTIAQGGRLLNYYLFTGGYNERIEGYKLGDGNDRIAITGERHGFAAPLNPEGKRSYGYDRMAEGLRTLNAHAEYLATMNEEHDDLVLGFIPDQFMTDSHAPGSEARHDQIVELERWRAGIPWDSMLKGVLLNNYRFTAVDLQRETARSDQVLMLPSTRYMNEDVQARIIQHVEGGGALFLFGSLPTETLAGEACTLLIDYLGLKPLRTVTSSQNYRPSIIAEGFLQDRAEVHIGVYEAFAVEDAAVADAETVLRPYDADGVCGVLLNHLPGKVLAMTTEYTADPDLYRRIMERLGSAPAYTHSDSYYGLFLTTSFAEGGGKLHHIFNLDHYEKDVEIRYQGEILFDGRLVAQESVMLAEDLPVAGRILRQADCELVEVASERLGFKASLRHHTMVLSSAEGLEPGQVNIEELPDGDILVTPTEEWLRELAFSGDQTNVLTLNFGGNTQ